MMSKINYSNSKILILQTETIMLHKIFVFFFNVNNLHCCNINSSFRTIYFSFMSMYMVLYTVKIIIQIIKHSLNNQVCFLLHFQVIVI